MKNTLRHYCALLLLPLLVIQARGVAAQTVAPTQEAFESGTKPDYATSTVTLSTGDWTFTDALLGTDANDHKAGVQAARVENNGKLTMNFYLPGGAQVVTVRHAAYGTDASSGWELWAQAQSCGCNNWSKVGATVFSTTTTLQTAAFTVAIPGNVKFEIRKVSGGSARLNLDDFSVTAYGQVPAYPDNDNLAMGNPSGATPDTNFPNNYLLTKSQYVVGYNASQGKPNWVSWHLDKSNRGAVGRAGDFASDPSLPTGFYQVQPTSYSGTGFDRGHNCPSADRTNTIPDNTATFLMSNMMPQAPRNNQQTWAGLENYTRTFVDTGNYEVYIVCGSYGKGGTGVLTNGTLVYAETIDQGRVQVPSRTWKVIVLLPVGSNDVARVDASTRIIAVDLPNDNGLDTNWGVYRTSVDAIEAATGYDLLSALPTSVQAVVEAKVDNGPTQ
ncbi:DNA/RNA non-specific endonuclease [Hymenobacter cheonanensis]|uniref:DNA/RNA non-specific endonuclease n=1 Tax=Hymenobacter sp. CA2-7 TaxID=3063993 RepID=UPI0027131380|nr:DNA/RNA non-specific endonuclease [Hymenobacter sp. CA2-7]MDO7885987.1 DNA/RNA non-specific endonuclease [Hymenobacter sp. CA2-7]